MSASPAFRSPSAPADKLPLVVGAWSVWLLAACGTPGRPVADPRPRAIVTPDAPSGGHLAELEAPDAPKKLIALDWSTVHPTTDAEAIAVWAAIAPTGADWSDKLSEIPADLPLAHALAVAFLRAGNFTCAAPGAHCHGVPIDVPAPAATADLADPCLRRLVALWALAQLEHEDARPLHDQLLAIASLPPPESELIAAALHVVDPADSDLKYELLAAAWSAGQRELVNSLVGELSDPLLVAAATKLHSDGALAILSAEAYRKVYLGAITDEQMARGARLQAIIDVTATEDPLAADSRAALVIAATSADCGVAASAARILDQTGDHRFVPRRPHAKTTQQALHALCVEASYAALQRADEPSLLPGFLPKRGLEIVTNTEDPLEHTSDIVPPKETILPEADDLVRAFDHCTGTTCASDSREFKLTFAPSGGELVLTRLELTERPACHEPDATPANPAP